MAMTAHIGNTPVGWLAVPEADMMPVLARKLPHYSKYSYAIFEGGQLQNQAKGMWSQTRSALQIAVRDGAGLSTDTARGKLQARKGLVSE